MTPCLTDPAEDRANRRGAPSDAARRRWSSLAALFAAITGAALLAGLHYTADLRLTGGRTILATTGLAMLAGFASLAALAGRVSRPLALAGLSIASVGAAAYWLLLGPNKFAGPVLFTFAHERGIHLTDPLAIVPLAIGVYLARSAWVAQRTR